MPELLDLEVLTRSVQQAIDTNNDGHPEQAAQHFEDLRQRILRSRDRRDETVVQHSRVLLGLASSRADTTGNVDAALGLLDTAEKLAQSVSAKHMQAAARGQRGLLFLRIGDTGRALAALDAAVELIDVAEPFDQMVILLNRSALHLERAALGSARDDLSRCAATADGAGNRDVAVKAKHNLGYVEFLTGHVPKALALMADAIDMYEDEPHPIMLLDRARVLREGGLTRDADAALYQAAELFARSKLFQDLGETELARADCALVENEPEHALALARSAVRRFKKRNNVRWQHKAEMAVLDAERARITDMPTSRRKPALRKLALRANTLASACAAEGRADLAHRATLLELEASLTADPDRGADAAALHTRLRGGDSMSTRLQTREVRAKVALAAGDVKAGVREVRRGLAELGSYQSRFGSLDLRTASAVHGVALARVDLGLAVGTGRAGAVFASIERTRAVSNRLAGVRPPSDPETADLLSQLRQVEEEIRFLDGDSSATDALGRLRSRGAALQRSVRARAWEQEGSSGVGPRVRPVGLGELRAELHALGAGFVSYAVHDGRWLAVVVAGRRTQVVPLVDVDTVDQLVRRVRADLDALAMPRLPEPLHRSVSRSLELGLSRLDETLLAPLRVDGVPLVVSPSGSLVVLPWSLLRSRRGLPVVVVSSATAWMRARAVPTGVGRPKVTVVAGPGLHRAEDEAVRVHRSWPGSTLLLGEAATTRSVGAALGAADVVHIAAHGTHQQESPLFSSVRVSDGPLYAYELDPGAGMAGCIALSACEAGLTTVRPGDEGLGMTSVLLHLGARSVLAGVARVRDDVAADVMERVHQKMAGSTDSATALALAQAECADHQAPAPFVCFGSGWAAGAEPG